MREASLTRHCGSGPGGITILGRDLDHTSAALQNTAGRAAFDYRLDQRSQLVGPRIGRSKHPRDIASAGSGRVRVAAHWDRA